MEVQIMSILAETMKKLHADNFAFYLKAHFYHWNIEDPDFKEYHNFLEEIYTLAFEDADAIAEQIRAIQEYAPGSLSRFKELTSIVEDDIIPATGLAMFERLLADLELVCASIMIAYNAANDANEIGLSNFLQDKYDARRKLAWMLRSTVKRR
jgi:starvation-inducible DNA-binding protein